MTPLDAEKRRLQREMEEKKQLIERAPQMKAEVEKRRREELVTRASRTEARFGSPGALLDPRYGFELNAGATTPRKLRRERNRGMWTFFALLILLGLAIYWVYSVVLSGLSS